MTALLSLLQALPGSYAGPTRPEPAPHALIGVGEGTLGASLARILVGTTLTHSGTQFVISSPDARSAATDYADLAEVAGAGVRRVGTAGTPEEIDVLIPSGPLSAYHAAQYVAHASGHADQAAQADALLTQLAQTCHPGIETGNPARDLAWSLWGRLPLLLAAPEAEALPGAWQHLLARTAKTLSVPMLGDPLALATGAFEAQHEKGDAKVALILGDPDPALHLTREILDSRIDEVIHVPYPAGAESGYAGQLALWYFGAWVAAYLAERYDMPAEDTDVLRRAQNVLSGEDDDRLGLEAPTRPTRPQDDEDDFDEVAGDLDDDEDDG